MTIIHMDEKTTRQPGRRHGRACKRLEKPLCPQYEPAMSNTRRAAIPLRWLRRGPFGTMGYLSILLMALFALPTSAVFIEFSNCLPDSVQNDTPLQLQFVPLFVDAKFNTTDPSNGLQVTVWGNVTGSGTEQTLLLPPINSPYWTSNDSNQGGKIIDNPGSYYTTLSNKVDVLTYEAWNQSVEFCNSLVNASCPLGPSFFANASVAISPSPLDTPLTQCYHTGVILTTFHLSASPTTSSPPMPSRRSLQQFWLRMATRTRRVFPVFQ